MKFVEFCAIIRPDKPAATKMKGSFIFEAEYGE
jgi:hypothetical protein